MSARDKLAPGTGGGGSGDPFYDPDGTPPARFFVDGRRIPIVNNGVTVRVRKDGPLSINRVADVHFPAKGVDTNWLSVLRYKQDTTLQSDLVRAAVDVYDETLDEYLTLVDGFLMGVGSGAATNNDMTARIGGPALLTRNVTASASYTTSTTLGEILRDALDQLRSQQPIFDNLAYEPQNILPSFLKKEEFSSPPVTPERSFFSVRNPISVRSPDETLGARGPKRFVPRKHTVADLLQWVEETFGVRIWFEVRSRAAVDETLDNFYDEGPRLLAADKPMSIPRYAAHLDGTVGVFEANPVAEVSPINGLRVQGAAKHLVDAGNLGTYTTPFTSASYPVAVAYVPRLVERAGGLLLGHEKVQKVGNEAELKPVARSRLKERLSSAGTGSIVTQLHSTLRPYTMFTTRPVVSGETATAAPQIFEIEEVTHRAEADSGPVTHWSELTVSVATPMDDIRVRSRTIPVKGNADPNADKRTAAFFDELDAIGDDVDSVVDAIYNTIADAL